MSLFAVAYDNFLAHADSIVTYSSEVATAPFRNVLDIEPTVFWETGSKTGQFVKLNLEDTGNRKPCFVGIYKHGFTKDLTITLETDTSDDFSTPEESEVYALEQDYHDFRTTGRGFQKIGYLFQDILEADVADKAWMRLKFTDAGNPNDFFRIGVLFLGSVISLNAGSRGYENLVKKFNDPSTVFYSQSNQMYVRTRQAGEVITVTVSAAGELTRMAVRRLIRNVGTFKPVFLMLQDGSTQDILESTQTYYGYFSSLPSMKELIRMEKSAIDLEKNSVTDYKFEFTEIL